MLLVIPGSRLPITRQAITKHLETLEQASLVTVHETGRERRYVPQPESLQTVMTWIGAIEAQWDHRLAALRSYLLEEPSTPSAQEKETDTFTIQSKERIQEHDQNH